MSIGSSWTVAGTLGIAFMGMGQAMQLNPAITAGAIISGAYFGDKLSPLSDTTNLAAAVTQTELFKHIRNLLWTTIPGFGLSLILFSLLGDSGQLNNQHIDIGWYLLLPVALVFVLAWRKVPALPTLAAGAMAGCIFAAVSQGPAISSFIQGENMGATEQTLRALWTKPVTLHWMICSVAVA